MPEVNAVPEANPTTAPPETTARLRRWLGATVVFLWTIVSWFILTDFPRKFAAPTDLDVSWRGVITYAAEQGWQWGRDIVFNYGPAGYLHLPVYTADSWWKSLLFQGLHAALYLFLLWRVARGYRWPGARWTLLVAGVLFPAFTADCAHFLLTWFTALVLARERSEGRPLARADQIAIWLGLAAITFGAHIKMTFLVQGLALVVLLGINGILRGRWRQDLFPAGFFILGYLALWGLLGQAYSHLPSHLYYSWELAVGHSEAMGLPAEPLFMILGALICATAFLLHLWPLRTGGRWRRQSGLALFTLLTLYLGWKQGLVRGDEPHVHALFGVALPMLLVGLMDLPQQTGPPRERWAWNLGVPIGAALLALLWQFPLQWQWAFAKEKLRWIRFTMGGTARIEAAFKRAAQPYQLPAIQREVGRSTVDMVGLLETLAIINGLDYRPAPAFQGYISYTRALIRLNTRYYQSANAPEYVIYRVSYIDNRPTTADNALVLLEILKNYTPILREREFVLFRRTPRGAVEKNLVAAGELKPGAILPLPAPGEPLFCELEIRETLLGKLFKQALYRPLLRLDTMTLESRQRVTYSIVPSMAGEGFLISPPVLSDSALVSLYDGTARHESLAIGYFLDADAQHLIQDSVGYKFYRLNLALPPEKEADTLAKIQALRHQWQDEDAERQRQLQTR